jgi:hypothetical protein
VTTRCCARACASRGSSCAFTVFTQTDRAAHCLWWLRDADHPYAKIGDSTLFAGRDPLLEVYRRMDQVIGDVAGRLGSDDLLLVVSDHGFQSFRYGFNINQWLLNEGYLVLKDRDPQARVGEANLPSFFNGSLTSDAVDWTRTRAYALGLGQIYLNRRGREPSGIVADAEVPGLIRELSEKLLAFRDDRHAGRAPLARVYDLTQLYRGPMAHHAAELQLGFAADYRVSWQTALLGDLRPKGTPPVDENKIPWSGDHCSTDRDLVPGFLLTNRALPARRPPVQREGHRRDRARHFHLDVSHLEVCRSHCPAGSRRDPAALTARPARQAAALRGAAPGCWAVTAHGPRVPPQATASRSPPPAARVARYSPASAPMTSVSRSAAAAAAGRDGRAAVGGNSGQNTRCSTSAVPS